jgi:hypothetical protein
MMPERPAGVAPAVLDLTTVDGNALALVGAVARGLRAAGNDAEAISVFHAEALSGDYDHVVATCLAYTEAP